MDENDILEALLKNFATVPTETDASEETAAAVTAAPAEAVAAQEEMPVEAVVTETIAATVGDFAEEDDFAEEPAPLPVLATEDMPAAEEVAVADTAAAADAADEPEIRVTPMEAPTQVISLDDDKEPVFPEEEPDCEGQLTMEDFVPEEQESDEDTPASTDDERSWEEQLLETRREKIRDFQIKQNRETVDFRYAGDAAPDEKPEKDAPVAADETAGEPEKQPRFNDDFTDFSQAEDVRAELQYRYHSVRFRLFLAAAAELLLLWSEFSVAHYGQPTIAASLFLILNIGLLTAVMALLFPMLRDGVLALCRLKPNADSVPAVVGGAAWLHAMLQWINLPAVETGDAPLFTAIAGLLLLFCGVGRLLKADRIRQNFTVVGHDNVKFAATMIQDEHTAVEIGRRAVATGVPRVAFFRPVKFLDDFLPNSYMDDRYDTVLRRFLPIAVAFCAVIGAVTGIVAGTVWTGLCGFVAALCVALPAASLAINAPLLRECHKLLENGNMLCGFAAAERFGDIHGVALDVSDLYLDDSVALHGIRTFGEARIDEAIMDAAAVAIRTDGPLCGLFRRIIEDKTEILPAVENLVFEQDMGFSGWVGGRRVLVGNRKLLENHGVDTPSGDYERRYKKDGRELVYLSVAGALSAMFIISYVTDPAVEDALRTLQQAHLSLLVRSCDPNVTEESLCAGFGLEDFYLDLLTASAGRLYDNLRHSEAERVSAGAAVNGTVGGVAQLLAACRRVRRRGIFAMILQMIGGLIAALFCFSSAIAGMVLPIPALLVLLVLTTVVSLLLPLVTK